MLLIVQGESYEIYPGVILKGKSLRDFWKINKGYDGDSQFVKNIAHVLWGPMHLKQHSVGGCCVKRVKDGVESVTHHPALDAPRMAAVTGVYRWVQKL